jgi:hypothetical protein
MLISNLHTARKPNELARATNESSRANLFLLVLLKSLAELARYFNEPDQAEPSWLRVQPLCMCILISERLQVVINNNRAHCCNVPV